MNEPFLTLFVFGAGAFLTWWFLLGLLTPFIEAAVAIVCTAISVLFDFFIQPLIIVGQNLIRPIRRILAPVWVKIPVYLILGVGIFVLDHFYNTKIFAEDELTFHRIVLMDRVFWVTEIAAWTGGSFIVLFTLYFVDEILKFINWLINRPIHISIVIQK